MAEYFLVPSKSEDIDISAANHTIALEGGAREIYCGTGGTLIAKLAGDTAFRTYKNVPNGGVVSGQFVAVQKTNTTTADMIARR